MNRRHFFQSSVAAAVTCALPYGRVFALDQAATGAATGIPAVTGSGAATIIEQAAIRELKASLRGTLLLSGDAGYDDARRVLNRSIDKRPALVVQPSGVADIRSAVTFANERQLLVAVKCGGHSFSGKSTCDGGLQIDLSRFRGVRVDTVARRAYVDGGSLLGDLDHETMAHGLVTTAGTVSHTGVGGLTLGGGFGRLARRFGLAIDNLRAVDIVTADGRYLHADADENPDLYWGVRGGGGNFGVVTTFEFNLHPMQRQVVGGDLTFPIARARELLEFYGEFSSNAPEALDCGAVMSIPAGGMGGVFRLTPCYSGPPANAERVLAPLRKLGTPISDMIKTQDYVAIQRSHDQTDPRNEGNYVKGGFISDFKGDMIDAIMAGFAGHPDRGTTLFFQQGGGTIGRVAADATAFPHRHAKYDMVTAIRWPLDIDRAPHIRYQREFWATLQRYTSGYYMNQVADEGQSALDENYQGNIGRMRRVKRMYDPGNLFRLNANVEPAV